MLIKLTYLLSTTYDENTGLRALWTPYLTDKKSDPSKGRLTLAALLCPRLRRCTQNLELKKRIFLFFRKRPNKDFILPSQCHEGMRVTSFRQPYDLPRTRSTSRAADNLSDKGILCCYTDRAYDYFHRYSS